MRVGLTGHQDIGSESDTDWVRRTLEHEARRPELTEGAMSLARGADQLYATLLQRVGKPFMVVLPCVHYEKTFTEKDDVERYRALIEQARQIVRLDFIEPSEEAFWAAGQRVVELSEYLLAVWNGLPAKGLGGTADVVEYAIARGIRVMHIDPLKRQTSIL